MRYGSSVAVAGLAIVQSDAGQNLVVGGEPSNSAYKGANIISRTPDAISEETVVSAGDFARLVLTEGTFDVYLPDPPVSAGQHVWFANYGDGGNIVLKASSGLINGTDATVGLALSPAPYEQLHAVCDGTDWWVASMTPGVVL